MVKRYPAPLIPTTLRQYSDEDLARLLREGNREAFEEIYTRYWSGLLAAAYKRLKSREDAEEIVQDLFASLWVRRNTLVLQGSLARYLFSSVKYMVINRVEAILVRRRYKAALVGEPGGQAHATQEQVYYLDLQSALQETVDKLPPRCRHIFVMNRFEGHTMKEIAVHLNISDKTVENQLAKALKILKTGLKHFLPFLLLTPLRGFF